MTLQFCWILGQIVPKRIVQIRITLAGMTIIIISVFLFLEGAKDALSVILPRPGMEHCRFSTLVIKPWQQLQSSNLLMTPGARLFTYLLYYFLTYFLTLTVLFDWRVWRLVGYIARISKLISFEWRIFFSRYQYVLSVHIFSLQRAQCSHCKRCISYSNSVRPSVCPSFCPSHAGIVSKRRHVARCSLHRWIAKCV